MTKLATQVRVNRRFQRSVRVDADIDEPAALEGFVCPSSTAQALIGMARQFAETGQGAFTWTGPYGSGKSSLAVALAALLGHDSRARAIARAAIGETASAELLSLLKAGRKPWTALPIVGSRMDAALAINAALEGPRRGRPRQSVDGNEVIERLKTAAADAPGQASSSSSTKWASSSNMHPVVTPTSIFSSKWRRLLPAVTGGSSSSACSTRRLTITRTASHAKFVTSGSRSKGVSLTSRSMSPVKSRSLLSAMRSSRTHPPRAFRPRPGSQTAIARNRPGTGAHLDRELQACWPLHPIAACLLGPLSRRRFGQNQRSVFGFLNSAEPHGFQDFCNRPRPDTNTPISLPGSGTTCAPIWKRQFSLRQTAIAGLSRSKLLIAAKQAAATLTMFSS